jgi:polyisoprenoid-binding protein YceI
MNRLKIIHAAKAIPLLLFFQAAGLLSYSQVQYASNSVDLVVSGTSTLHDWDMRAVKANCTARFTFNGGTISGLSALNFSTPAVALKSDHTSMDNNAYKALKTDKNPTISYTMLSVTVTPAGPGTSTVKCTGRLTIAGTTSNQDIVAQCKVNGDNTITVSGVKAVSMKDFNIAPPTFMFGTVKTGNDIVLKFNLVLKKI